MIVCLCRRVSDRDIVQAVREGTTDFGMLQAETGVATQCGRCRDCACEVFEAALAHRHDAGAAHRAPHPAPVAVPA